MTRWEYDVVRLSVHIDEAVQEMDLAGKDGWELVATTSVYDVDRYVPTLVAFFKRPLPENDG